MNNRKEMKKNVNIEKQADIAGILINRAGKNRYINLDATEKLITYIAREQQDAPDDLLLRGALGATTFTDINTTIHQFECVHLLHNRHGVFGRYIDHEIYSFSPSEEAALYQKNVSFTELAQRMADDFYQEGFQVYYGIHQHDEENLHLHIHFAVNTVNFRTGKKRHEGKKETAQRQQRLQQIVAEAIEQITVL